MAVINTLGRRKTSVARVYLTEGKGNITVNKRDVKDYLSSDLLVQVVNRPFAITENMGKYDVKVNAHGGGVSGQAEAIALGISRALVEVNEEHKSALKAQGLMTRDPRMVERKKPGQKKARKKFQFSKR